jgi:hypothetical protein
MSTKMPIHEKTLDDQKKSLPEEKDVRWDLRMQMPYMLRGPATI